MFITNDIRDIGVNDHSVDLFEGQCTVPNGIAYNSYVILDEGRDNGLIINTVTQVTKSRLQRLLAVRSLRVAWGVFFYQRHTPPTR